MRPLSCYRVLPDCLAIAMSGCVTCVPGACDTHVDELRGHLLQRVGAALTDCEHVTFSWTAAHCGFVRAYECWLCGEAVASRAIRVAMDEAGWESGLSVASALSSFGSLSEP
jgi:hypothetical protein